MDFLPASTTALVTEKGGRLWLIDVGNGARQEVAGASQGRCGRAGRAARREGLAALRPGRPRLSDLRGAVAERRQPARARASQAGARGLPGAAGIGGHLAQSDRRQGRAFRRADRLRARRQLAVPQRGRAPALHAGAGPQPADGQDPPPDPRREAECRTVVGDERLGASTVMVTDPPEDSEVGEARQRPAVHLAGAEPHAGGDLDARPPQPARARVRARRAAVGDRDGAEGRRRAQPDPRGPQLRLSARLQRHQLQRRRHPRPSSRRRLRSRRRPGGTRRSRRPTC